MAIETHKIVKTSQTVKIIKRKQSLDKILPPMIISIIEDHVVKYVQDNHIKKYNVELGYIEETITVLLDERTTEVISKDLIMTYQAKVIEAYLFDYFKTSSDIYLKTRLKGVLRIRYVIQFFMAVYSEMTLADIGLVTGKKDHATVGHARNMILGKIKKNNVYKKQMFIIDRSIANTLAIPSRLFDIYGEIIFDKYIE
jgi:chromosomal replication initiation ATPase DnaA